MARNASGTYSLPAGRPVVSGTVISATAENTFDSDLATEITNSLDRTGKGSMQAALKLTDGSVTAPGVAFSNETGTGLFRNAASDLRLAVAGVLRAFWNSTGFKVISAVADGASAVAHTFDSTSTLSNATAKLTSWATGGSEKMALRADGALFSPVADGASAVGLVVDTANSLANASAKLLSVKNAGVEKFSISKDGLTRPSLPAVGQQISAVGTTFSTTSATFVDVTSRSVSLTTSGRPVLIFVPGLSGAGNFSLSANASASLALLRGVTQLTQWDFLTTGGGASSWPSGVLFVDVVAAGTYTYKLQVKTSAGTVSISAEIGAFEL